jgi:hypothetical protein
MNYCLNNNSDIRIGYLWDKGNRFMIYAMGPIATIHLESIQRDWRV